MKDSPTLKDLLQGVGETTGRCDKCSSTGCDYYCVDIKGTYNGKKFVLDAKFYTSGRYISKEDINKLGRDMGEYKAKVGFILTFGAHISKQKEADAIEKGMFIIHVYDEDDWISTFVSKFK